MSVIDLCAWGQENQMINLVINTSLQYYDLTNLNLVINNIVHESSYMIITSHDFLLFLHVLYDVVYVISTKL